MLCIVVIHSETSYSEHVPNNKYHDLGPEIVFTNGGFTVTVCDKVTRPYHTVNEGKGH